jgi:hypothetical protein
MGGSWRLIVDAQGTALISDDTARGREDGFGRALELIENRRRPDPAAGGTDVMLRIAQHYAYVFPTDSALAMLAGLGPLVEMGAGTGYWARRLRWIGVDIVAFDQAPVDGERTNRYHSRARPWSHVEQGDQRVLSGYAERCLFLCWPPLFSSLGDCLTYYSGNTVACIGDGGCRTARIDRLDETFTKTAAVPVRALDPDPGARPELTIWKRVTGRAGQCSQYALEPGIPWVCEDTA